LKQILIVGDLKTQDLLPAALLEGLPLHRISTSADVDAYLEQNQHSVESPVFVTGPVESMLEIEIAQAFSSYFQGAQIYLVTQVIGQEHTDFRKMRKNGFSEVFLLPMDRRFLESLLRDCRIRFDAGGASYKSVKIMDIEPGEKLPFKVSTYLPLNRKFMPLTATGELSQEKFKKLQERGTQSVYLDAKSVNEFYEYCAERLAKLADPKNQGVSESEREEKLQSSVRTLFQSFLGSADRAVEFEQGRQLMEQSMSIVDRLVGQRTGVDLKKQFRAVISEDEGFYSHAQSVSAMAGLMSMALKIGRPEDLAIAGLFHDLGLDRLDREASVFEYDQLSPEEKEIYRAHPKRSVALVKDKRVGLLPIVSEIILKHHERQDGKGFPDGLPAHKIPMEAQLLGYVDAFEYLTRRAPGHPTLTPLQAHRKIKEQLSFSVELLSQIESFLRSVDPSTQASSPTAPPKSSSAS
jgi:HD-GYP domain-containing protein (c-di-GMP phosphodiesterase class II)